MTLKFHFPISVNAVHNEFIRKSDGQPRFFPRRQCFTSILFASGGEKDELPGKVAGDVTAQEGGGRGSK